MSPLEQEAKFLLRMEPPPWHPAFKQAFTPSERMPAGMRSWPPGRPLHGRAAAYQFATKPRCATLGGTGLQSVLRWLQREQNSRFKGYNGLMIAFRSASSATAS